MGDKKKTYRKGYLRRTMRLQFGCGSNAYFEKRVRAVRPDAPAELKKYALFEWYAVRLPNAPRPARSTRPQQQDPRADEFLRSYAWRKLRMEVLVERGARCECCGATPGDGTTVINVDHIKPRRDFPELALVKANLQVLCETCNHGKGNWDRTDWRAGQPAAFDPGPYADAADAMREQEAVGGVRDGAGLPGNLGEHLRPRLVRKR